MAKNVFITAVLLLVFCGCHKQKICGVPVQGTPWELAASIADKGDGSFIPECVYQVKVDEALIEGWSADDSSQIRPFIRCEVKDGQVVSAAFKTTLEDLED